jgi:hypothetical protein
MSPTPAGVTITATKPDGTTVDVTEGVQVLYDRVIGSMDWGSGFLSVEDAVPIAEIAEVCGFAGIEEAERYLRQARHEEEEGEYRKAHPESRRAYGDQRHEHVFSGADGVCMWWGCLATNRLT